MMCHHSPPSRCGLCSGLFAQGDWPRVQGCWGSLACPPAIQDLPHKKRGSVRMALQATGLLLPLAAVLDVDSAAQPFALYLA